MIKRRKWIGHTIHRPAGSIVKTSLNWNPLGTRKSGRSEKKRGTEQSSAKREKPIKNGHKNEPSDQYMLRGVRTKMKNDQRLLTAMTDIRMHIGDS